MLNDSITLKGNLTFKLVDSTTGEVKLQRTDPNLVVTTGKEFVASRIIGVAQPIMSRIDAGSTDTAPVAGNVALANKLGEAPIDLSTQDGNSVTYTATLEAGVATGAIVEAGVFNVNNVMLCRSVFPVVNKQANDILTIVWTVAIN